MTGDLIKIQLRDGTQYSCTGVVDFLQPILDEHLNDYPEVPILLRGDSGFATPVLYKQCEENGTSYVIRLKENGILREKVSYLVNELDEITRNNKVDYAVVYGEFMYKEVHSLMKGVWYARLKSRKTRWFTCTHSLSQTWIHHQSILSNFTVSED